VDRDVFRRQVHYEALTQPGAAVQSADQAGVAQPAPSRK
jgi:hypothetical protein